MQSTGALANETSQELGGSCANTRDSDIVSPASPPDTIGPYSGGATGGGKPKRARRSADNFDAGQFDDPEWAWVGDRRMLVVGHTPGGAPFGCFEDELEDLG